MRMVEVSPAFKCIFCIYFTCYIKMLLVRGMLLVVATEF